MTYVTAFLAVIHLVCAAVGVPEWWKGRLGFSTVIFFGVTAAVLFYAAYVMRGL